MHNQLTADLPERSCYQYCFHFDITSYKNFCRMLQHPKKFLAVRVLRAHMNNQVCNANLTATEGGCYRRSDILALPKFAIT